MRIFKALKKSKKKTFVLGLDGVPFSFISEEMKKGNLPYLKKTIEKGSLRRMNSSIPCISSVAWSSFMTGSNPACHNIFGFIDRIPNPFKIFIPTGRDIRGETLWSRLSNEGKKVIVINVPVTFPPEKLNGILISGFLSPKLDRATYPPQINTILKDMGYKIDVDAWEARRSLDKFLEDIDYTLEKRIEAAQYFMDKEQWDYAHLHIMETDRINHFLWEHYEKQIPPYSDNFLKFYQKIDSFVGELEGTLDDNTEFIILSDHGFCSVKKEVYVNYWMENAGYLRFSKAKPESAADMDSSSSAYSLIPGRIFINMKGREQMGSVTPGSESKRIIDELKERLIDMIDPDTGDKIIERVIKKDEIYQGPCLSQAADLIALPRDGYDLKGNIRTPEFTSKGPLVGMHTYPDAFFYVRDREIIPEDNEFDISRIKCSILSLMGIDIPPEDEHRVIL